MLDHGGLKNFFEKRQKLEANSRAHATGVAVGRVLAPSLTAKAQVRAQFVAAECQQGTKDDAGFRVNSGEPGETGAAKNVGENGFGLVIGSVGNGNFVEVSVAGEAFKEGVAGAAGGVFEVGVLEPGLGGHVFVRKEKWKIVAGGEGSDESFISFGGSATQFVIEVGDEKDDAESFAEFEKKKE
jgi:hypothetical protein